MPWQGRYPLNRAVSSSNISTEIVQFLLDNGADIDLANRHPGLLLNEAYHGTIYTLRLLLDRGLTYPPDDFERWFGILVDGCPVETVHLLLEYGYTSNIEMLSIAIRVQRGNILQLLIDSGIDLNMRDTRGFTLLHTAIFRCIPSDPPIRIGHGSIVCRRPGRKSLVRKIETGPQRVSPPCMSDKVEKYAPEEIGHCLIRGGADCNTQDARGRTPLALARKCSPAIQQILVDGGGE
ncbi:ankyrin repeat-containing protein [Penicillium malachiteum]|uniref:ankyrin repeat-containing protein n=1 Tax=Penicillium malachiteum TaxID=1324776 RepID=UPI00254702D9|nr:ankyrin repeat-containing protein [Penicillium malachiteum]KAJ5726131.1 ankyrin repeat-containing protein [Penicillium malachiteum]